MSHLMETMQRMADNDPHMEKIDPVPVGTMVQYHGRSGSMRQGRTVFPAMVLKQHEDDGSLDMIVFFEAEDIIWEQRILPMTEARTGNCWEPVENASKADMLKAMVRELKHQMYGDYDAPSKSMIEYLDDFDKRLQRLEKKLMK
jgi:hypothetical protein